MKSHFVEMPLQIPINFYFIRYDERHPVLTSNCLGAPSLGDLKCTKFIKTLSQVRDQINNEWILDDEYIVVIVKSEIKTDLLNKNEIF